MMKLEITADKVKEAAARCPQAEATLKTLFPEVFEIDKYFDFKEGFILDESQHSEPFFVGLGMAPDDLRRKCLVVHPRWEVVLSSHNGHQIIIPKRK